eukprot:5889160-Amphidinium_carterae.1
MLREPFDGSCGAKLNVIFKGLLLDQHCTANSTHVRVVAERIKFPTTLEQFNPCRAQHLTPWVALTYQQPSSLENRGSCKAQPTIQQRNQREVLKLTHKWDIAKRLWLVPARMSKNSDRAGITALLKDETHDRLILDRMH